MSTEIITAIITGVTTLLVSIGTWHVSMKQYRAKTNESIAAAIEAIKDTVTENNAKVQEHLSIIDYEVKTLSERVDKHNNLIDRTYKLEADVKLNTSEINHLNEKVS